MSALPAFSTLGAGPTVLLLHGSMGSHRAFAPQVESLASAGYRAVAWDMPGYGRSAPVEPYAFKALARRGLDLLDSLGCGRVALVGQGLGGMVAQELVARWPERVSHLVLCATGAQGGAADGPLGGLDADLALGHDSLAQLAERYLPRLVGPAALPEGLRLASHCMAGLSPVTWRRALAIQPGFDRRADLARIHVPTLLVAGELDRRAPAAAMQAMAQAIAGSTLVVLRGVGHLPSLEAPEAFDRALLQFLALPRWLH